MQHVPNKTPVRRYLALKDAFHRRGYTGLKVDTIRYDWVIKSHLEHVSYE